MAIIKVRDENGDVIDIPAIVGPPGADYVLTESDKAEIAAQAAELVEVPTEEQINDLIDTKLEDFDIPSGGGVGGSSNWELLYETVIETQVSWMDIKSFDLTRGEYLVAILVPQVETQINSAHSRLFDQRGVRTHAQFAMTSGKMLHMFYAKKISENEALYIGYEAEKSEGFQDLWSRTNKMTVMYGGFNASEGLNISNAVPVGTHIKIYGK